MAFLQFSDAAYEQARTLAPSLGQDVAKRILARSFQIAIARGADADPLHRTGDRIELTDLQTALAEVEPRP
jgi:hypothetical protein